MKTILILGAAGFIGRHLAEDLATDGYRIIAATRRPANFDHSQITNHVSTFIRRDDFQPVYDCDVVIHAASSSTPASSTAQPQLDGNLRTTLALIEALQECPRPKVIFLSSGGTLYGNTPQPVDESAKLYPRSYHAAGKIAAEYFLQVWAAQYSGDLTILRPSNVYGPGQLPKPGFGIIPTAFANALKGTPLHVLGDGNSMRDYLYIDDLLQLCKLVTADSPQAGTRIFNAASGVTMILNTLLDTIDQTTGLPLSRHYEPERVVDIQHVLLNNDAVRHAYGWQPNTSIKNGLAMTWAWQRQHT